MSSEEKIMEKADTFASEACLRLEHEFMLMQKKIACNQFDNVEDMFIFAFTLGYIASKLTIHEMEMVGEISAKNERDC